jgi:uncharacterized protein (TIGR02246 family)
VTVALEDRLEIQELYARWAEAIDYGDPEAWANCFTDDGTLFNELDGIDLRGREALRAFAAEYGPSSGRHWACNFIMEADGEEVRTRFYIALLMATPGDATIPRTGRYADRLVRTDGGWRIRERVALLDPIS